MSRNVTPDIELDGIQ